MRSYEKPGASNPADCWIWNGRTDRDGYGRAGRGSLAHRLAYANAHGPIPEGLTVDHLCRNRACVNPSHLEAVTFTENVRRALPFRIENGKTHCLYGHEFTPENTYAQGARRQCRACNRRRAAEYAARKRAA